MQKINDLDQFNAAAKSFARESSTIEEQRLREQLFKDFTDQLLNLEVHLREHFFSSTGNLETLLVELLECETEQLLGTLKSLDEQSQSASEAALVLKALKRSLDSSVKAYREAYSALQATEAMMPRSDEQEQGERRHGDLLSIAQLFKRKLDVFKEATPAFLCPHESGTHKPTVVRGTRVPLGCGAYLLRRQEEARIKAIQEEKREAKKSSLKKRT